MRRFAYFDSSGKWVGPITAEGVRILLRTSAITFDAKVKDFDTQAPVALLTDPEFGGSGSGSDIPYAFYPRPPTDALPEGRHSKARAQYLAWRYGAWGSHLFYLGYKRQGRIRLITTLVSLAFTWLFFFLSSGWANWPPFLYAVWLFVVIGATFWNLFHAYRDYFRIRRGNFPDANGLPLV